MSNSLPHPAQLWLKQVLCNCSQDVNKETETKMSEDHIAMSRFSIY